MDEEVPLTADTMASFKVGKMFAEHSKTISSIDIDASGAYVIASSAAEDTLNLYDATAGKHKKLLFSKKYGVDCARFAHRPSNILHASTKIDDTIRYLSLHDNQYLRYFKGHKSRVTSIECSPLTDAFISASAESVRMWDLRTPTCQGLMTLTTMTAAAGSVTSPPLLCVDPKSLVFGVALDSRSIRLYDMRAYQHGPFATFSFGGGGSVAMTRRWCDVQFSPEGGDLLVSTDDTFLLLVDSFDGSLKERYDGNINDERLSLRGTFSPDGRFVLCGAADGTISVWERVQKRTHRGVLCSLEGQADAIDIVRFNPRYSEVVSAAGGQLAMWIPAY